MAGKVFITMGDPRGIGSRIIFKSLEEIKIPNADINIIGDSNLLLKEAQRQGFDTGKIKITGIKSSARPGADSLSYIDRALKEILIDSSAALVTGPVEKKAIANFKKGFRGQTEYIASHCKTPDALMSFVAGNVKMSLLTTHIPVSAIAAAIKKEKIVNHIRTVCRFLEKYFKIKHPSIALCSLNPHRGEGGLMGMEEQMEMIPALEKLKAEKICVEGPLNASFALKETLNGKYDFAVSAYHDQLLPAVKATLGPAVNLTIGLPFIRTSPDHGPALDLPPSAEADHRSMKKAIETAISLSV